MPAQKDCGVAPVPTARARTGEGYSTGTLRYVFANVQGVGVCTHRSGQAVHYLSRHCWQFDYQDRRYVPDDNWERVPEEHAVRAHSLEVALIE